jgi:phage-related protein
LKVIRQFGGTACRAAGHQLELVQRGAEPDDWKPMPTVGRGVQEIRLWDETGTYRVIYTARVADTVYVLHAFQKKTQATSKRDIDLAKDRLAALMKEIR